MGQCEYDGISAFCHDLVRLHSNCISKPSQFWFISNELISSLPLSFILFNGFYLYYRTSYNRFVLIVAFCRCLSIRYHSKRLINSSTSYYTNTPMISRQTNNMYQVQSFISLENIRSRLTDIC